jgi:hypothetical protein
LGSWANAMPCRHTNNRVVKNFIRCGFLQLSLRHTFPLGAFGNGKVAQF